MASGPSGGQSWSATARLEKHTKALQSPCQAMATRPFLEGLPTAVTLERHGSLREAREPGPSRAQNWLVRVHRGWQSKARLLCPPTAILPLLAVITTIRRLARCGCSSVKEVPGPSRAPSLLAV